MKSQLNKYRQYTISDYLLNQNKFIEYLEFCKKYNLKKEKKYIMEYLVRTLQLKENCVNVKVLSEIKTLCVLLIIYSDFEIELLFELEYFIPDMQKKIFYEVEQYLNNENNIKDDKLKIYIKYKYNLWILKLQNKNFIARVEIKNSFLGENEIKESIENLTNYINIEKDNFKNKNQNEQLFIIKIYYELSLYNYFKNNVENTINYLNTLINYYNEYINTNNILVNSKEHKLIYFDIENIKYLYNYVKNNISTLNNIKNNDIIMTDNNNINNEFFNEEEIEYYDKIIDEDYIKYKNEIDKTKNDSVEQLSLSNENSLNLCEINNKNCINSLLNSLKIADFLIDITLKNYNYYKIGKNFIDSLKIKTENKIKTNTNKKDESDLQYIKKEITYYETMFQIIENMINKEDKLPKLFFKNLSEFITNNTLTGNLKLSGLIHSNMINFSQNYKILNKYFMGFTQFFKEKKSVYKKETINQIEFITKIVELFYIITEEKNKINFPLDKEFIIDIKPELHIELINIFIFWLNCDENNKIKEDSKKKEQKKVKKTLRYHPSINIIFILIESLKNLEFLKILKVIISNVLEFIIKKKHLNDTENNTELYEYIYEIKPKLFKINNLLDGVLRNIKVIVDEQVYYINFKINFQESPVWDNYMLKSDYLFCYISTLFKLLRILNDKIYKYESIKKITEFKTKNSIQDLNEKISDIINEDNKENENLEDIINNKKNNFLLYFYYVIENNMFKIEKEVKLAIMYGINYLNLYINNFKLTYMKNNLLIDISKIKKNYDIFKTLLNQDVLYQLILCFIKQKRYLEGAILLQYTKKFDSIVAYKLLQYTCEKNDFINIENFKYIWKMVLFEYLANHFYKINNYDALEKIKKLIKRVSNHQFFKGHPFRKHFKIVNFINFLDYLNNNKYNF